MSNTPNYNLYLTDDSSTRFQEWRNQMNGTENSNMVKIDAALGEKANSSVAINTTLLASAWVGVDAPYTQTLTISGLTASQNGTISVAHNATAEQREIAREAMLSVIGQADGTLTIAADGEMPERDIPVPRHRHRSHHGERLHRRGSRRLLRRGCGLGRGKRRDQRHNGRHVQPQQWLHPRPDRYFPFQSLSGQVKHQGWRVT